MAKEHQPSSSVGFHYLCYLLFVLSTLSSISFIYWSHCSSPPCKDEPLIAKQKTSNGTIDLLSFPSAWNSLSFSLKLPLRRLKIALFVKRWPQRNHAGGLERHALNLHLALARRGHEVHIFTPKSNSTYYTEPNTAMKFHLTQPSPAGNLDQASAWELFQSENSSGEPFDIVHTESVSLFHARARNLSHLAASWHGIAYETIHSDIVQDLLRSPNETRNSVLSQRIVKVIDEVKFFKDYQHHIPTSDHVGDVLKRVYMIPEERVHVIVNGVDEEVFRPDLLRRTELRGKFAVPDNASLVIGLAGRLVKDKGHPLMFEALKCIFEENKNFSENVYVLIAGDGPWGSRYKKLGHNVLFLGSLEQDQLAMFYNALDIYANPTLRAQGLDHTIIEAMLSGTPVLATRFASITGSLIVGPDIGYAYAPTVDSLKNSLLQIFKDCGEVLKKKGEAARNRAAKMFTVSKMATAYERLFLCISRKAGDRDDYCRYPLRWD